MMEWVKTQMVGTIRLDVYATPQARSYYKLQNTAAWRPRVLLEMDIEQNGRRLDYLALDRFWGCAPRPFLG